MSRRAETPAGRLLRWFRRNARQLPWRTSLRDPYRVLVSELMLQQTQVERVAPFYSRFVEHFPDLASLAAASIDEVLEAWSGLGYYGRARSLHRLAQEVVGGGGELPSTAAELARLPGVGPYTAAAVASLAFGRPDPVLDGNVSRVGARVLGLRPDPRRADGRRAIEAWVASLFAGHPCGEVNEALMELGATVCRPRSVDCERCPLAADCRARAEGNPLEYPLPRTVRAAEPLRWVAACVSDPQGRWLLRQVTDGPVLRGLWLPPLAELGDGEDAWATACSLVFRMGVVVSRQLPPVRHSITFRRITVVPVHFVVAPPAEILVDDRWVDPQRPDLPTSSLLSKLARAAGRL